MIQHINNQYTIEIEQMDIFELKRIDCVTLPLAVIITIQYVLVFA